MDLSGEASPKLAASYFLRFVGLPSRRAEERASDNSMDLSSMSHVRVGEQIILGDAFEDSIGPMSTMTIGIRAKFDRQLSALHF